MIHYQVQLQGQINPVTEVEASQNRKTNKGASLDKFSSLQKKGKKMGWGFPVPNVSSNNLKQEIFDFFS